MTSWANNNTDPCCQKKDRMQNYLEHTAAHPPSHFESKGTTVDSPSCLICILQPVARVCSQKQPTSDECGLGVLLGFRHWWREAHISSPWLSRFSPLYSCCSRCCWPWAISLMAVVAIFNTSNVQRTAVGWICNVIDILSCPKPFSKEIGFTQTALAFNFFFSSLKSSCFKRLVDIG